VPVWGWIVIAIAILLILILLGWMVWTRRRTGMLQTSFGPEYERTVQEVGDRRGAESELQTRRKRLEKLDIRPLSPEARRNFAEAWQGTQSRFVDEPNEAVSEADRLVVAVMSERGYPMEDFDQRAADVSVDHPMVVQDYRAAHAVSLANKDGRADTEALRQAMVHYRSLFEELLLGSEEGERGTADQVRTEAH
jgi:hypothetical protein